MFVGWLAGVLDGGCDVKLTGVVGMLLAFVLSVYLPAPALAQVSIVDTQLEVSTAVAQSSLTTEAIKKADDTKCRTYQARIDTLTGQVKAGKAQKAELIAAKQSLVDRLSELDATYKAEISTFRGAVTGIASTGEGAAALARYNAGDQAGALAILDKLQAADELARQKATDIQKAAGERHIAELASDARDKGKVTTDSVIIRYEGVVKLDPGVFWDWIGLDRLYQDAGRLADARRAAETAAKVADNDREKSAALEGLGNVLQLQGDLAGAGKASAEMLATLRRLAAADPSNAGAQRDVADALNRTGEVLEDQGDLVGAGKAYAECLAIVRRLAAADPTNANAQRVVAAALEYTGEVLQAQGDLVGAGRAYAEDLAIDRRVAAADPTNADAQRGGALALNKIGNVLQAQGDLAGAGKAYAEDLAISRRLAAADPSNAGAQRNVSVALGKTGAVLQAQGDLAGAGKAYAEDLAIARRLATAYPTDADAQRSVSVALEKTGKVLQAQGDLVSAGKAYAEQLAIARRLAAADPTNADAQRDVADALSKTGEVLQDQGDLVDAGRVYAEDLAITRRLAAADATNADDQRDLWAAMFNLATTGNPSIHWSEVVAQMEALDARGMLAPSDRHFLDEARANAAKAVGK
jgi:tetratricopeptide (TPR) repeat protein